MSWCGDSEEKEYSMEFWMGLGAIKSWVGFIINKELNYTIMATRCCGTFRSYEKDS